MEAYIDVEGRKRRLLIKPTHIEITRAEGPTYLCGKTFTGKTYHDAHWHLLMGSTSAPKGGAYDKHDFLVRFADGYEYRGRFDLQHRSHHGLGGPRLEDHMRGFIEWLATDPRGALYGADVPAEAQQLLQTHDFGQIPPVLSDDDPSEIVRDYRSQPITDEELGLGRTAA